METKFFPSTFSCSCNWNAATEQVCSFHLFLFLLLLLTMIRCPMYSMWCSLVAFGCSLQYHYFHRTVVCWRRQSHSIYISLPSKCAALPSLSLFILPASLQSTFHINSSRDACSNFKKIHESNKFSKGGANPEYWAVIDISTVVLTMHFHSFVFDSWHR